MSYDDIVLADSPVAYWKFNDAPGATVAADSSGNGNVLTLLDSPVLDGTQITFPLSSSTGAQSASAAPFAFIGAANQAFSYEFWANAFADTQSGPRIINKLGTYESNVQPYNGPGKLEWTPQCSGTGGEAHVSGGPDVTTAGYLHVFSVRSVADNQLKLYINGIFQASIAYSASSDGSNSNPLTVAAPGTHMAIKRMAVYDHEVSAANIRAHFLAGIGTQYNRALTPNFAYLNNPLPKGFAPKTLLKGFNQSPDVYVGSAIAGVVGGTIAGTVKVDGLVASRSVRVFERKSNLCVAASTANADGSFAFHNLKKDRQYYVLGFDDFGAYNAVIFDRIVPV